MADTLTTLYKGTLSSSAAVTLFTSSSLATTIVKEVVLCNGSTAASTVTLTFDSANILSSKSLAAAETYVIELHSVLGASKDVAAQASSTKVDAFISGIAIA